MNIKVELSDDDARSLRDRWEEEMNHHQGLADSLQRKIAAIDAELSGQIPNSTAGIVTKSGKRKKGENFLTIQEFLKGTGVRGATITEIHERTGLPVSSCNAVVKRHGDIFAKGPDDLWRVRP